MEDGVGDDAGCRKEGVDVRYRAAVASGLQLPIDFWIVEGFCKKCGEQGYFEWSLVSKQ